MCRQPVTKHWFVRYAHSRRFATRNKQEGGIDECFSTKDYGYKNMLDDNSRGSHVHICLQCIWAVGIHNDTAEETRVASFLEENDEAR